MGVESANGQGALFRGTHVGIPGVRCTQYVRRYSQGQTERRHDAGGVA